MGLSVLTFAVVLPSVGVIASQPGRGNLFYNGVVVRTIVPPAAFPNAGVDNFYVVTNGAAGQLGIASVAPGNPNYHGGHWAVSLVTFKLGITPFLLTSQTAVLSAQSNGQITVTRNPAQDFLCPIQP